MIRNASYATAKEVTDYIKKLGISRVDLHLEDIESILNTLIFDGKIERTVMFSTGAKSNNNEYINLFRAVNSILPANINDDCDEQIDEVNNENLNAANKINSTNNNNITKVKGYGSSLVRVPCGICPVIDDCNEDGLISPKTCIYMKEWLEF